MCAPRKSCSRTIDDEILTRPVKETDLLLPGSVHPGGLLLAITVHGVTCIELAGTVGTSEPNSLGDAMLYSWLHNAPNYTLEYSLAS